MAEDFFNVDYKMLYPKKDFILDGIDLVLLRLSANFHRINIISELNDIYRTYYDTRIDIGTITVMIGLVNDIPVDHEGNIFFELSKQYMFPDIKHAYLILDRIHTVVLGMYRKEVLKID